MASYLTSLKGGEQKEGEEGEWGKRGREERKGGREGGGREKRSSVCKEDQFTVPSPHQRGCNFDHHPTSHLDRVRTWTLCPKAFHTLYLPWSKGGHCLYMGLQEQEKESYTRVVLVSLHTLHTYLDNLVYYKAVSPSVLRHMLHHHTVQG